jgi:hypothetical protein
MNEIEVWIHKDGRTNTVAQAALVVVQSRTELPPAFEDALLERMHGGGMPGQYIYTDRVGKRDDGSYLHFLHACQHDEDTDAFRESVAWVEQLAAQHGLAVKHSGMEVA